MPLKVKPLDDEVDLGGMRLAAGIGYTFACKARERARRHSALFRLHSRRGIGYGCAMKLKRRNWSERNFKALNEFLAGVRPGEIAVFDWDNTCIFGDIGEALLRRLTFDLAYRHGRQNPGRNGPRHDPRRQQRPDPGPAVPLKKMKDAVFTAYERLEDKGCIRRQGTGSTRITASSPRGCWP